MAGNAPIPFAEAAVAAVALALGLAVIVAAKLLADRRRATRGESYRVLAASLAVPRGALRTGPIRAAGVLQRAALLALLDGRHRAEDAVAGLAHGVPLGESRRVVLRALPLAGPQVVVAIGFAAPRVGSERRGGDDEGGDREAVEHCGSARVTRWDVVRRGRGCGSVRRRGCGSVRRRVVVDGRGGEAAGARSGSGIANLWAAGAGVGNTAAPRSECQSSQWALPQLRQLFDQSRRLLVPSSGERRLVENMFCFGQNHALSTRYASSVSRRRSKKTFVRFRTNSHINASQTGH